MAHGISGPIETASHGLVGARDAAFAAFSLVELSIVLVILGLLTGGVLAGQSLIRAAEIRSYIADSQRFFAATTTFRDRYFAAPGDMRDATRFWETLAGNGSDATCQNTEASSRATCNGNGDGRVHTSVVTYDERFRFWQHLADAGLIEGSYTGRTDSSTAGSFVMTAGKNSPAVKGAGAVTVYYVLNNLGGDFMMAGLPAGNYLEFRGQGTNKPLTPEELWNIDTKLDDGLPGFGSVNGPKSSWSSPACTTTDDAATSVYDLALKARACRYNMRLF